MRRWVSPLALVLVSACAPSAVAGEAVPAKVIGVTQRSTVDGALDVTPLVLLDPAPTYEENQFSSEPSAGDRLVAVQFRVTNSASEDQLIGPTGRVTFHGSGGETFVDSLVDTSAGAMLDQLRLAPRQTMVGYVAAEVPEDVTVVTVDFETGNVADKEVLTWAIAGQAGTEPPKPAARKGPGPATEKLGAKRDVEGTYQTDEYRLTVTATKLTDPAETDDPQIQIGPNERLLGIDFTVHNDGKIPYSDVESDADLRVFAVQNKEDEAYTSHVYGATEEHGMPLMPGDDDTWHVLFAVPTGFAVDRVSFSPSFGDKVATVWTI